MFLSCFSLPSVPLFNTAAGTVFTTMFNSCANLAVGAMTGTTRAISYITCKLSHDAIVDIFNAVGIAAGAQNLTVTTNPGTAALTGPEIAIATGKGWTVVT
jgi:hypothetical protein